MNAYYTMIILATLINNAFMNNSQANHRRNCSKCPLGWGVRKTCTRHTNTRCERCVSGITYSAEFSSFSPCWQCSRCGVGLYEAHKCSSISDTVCDDCTRVFFKPELKHNKNFRQQCGYLFLH